MNNEQGINHLAFRKVCSLKDYLFKVHFHFHVLKDVNQFIKKYFFDDALSLIGVSQKNRWER